MTGTVDRQTKSCYDENALAVSAGYETMQLRFWNEIRGLIPQGRKILDLGCGSGRDLSYFAANGFDCWGIDGSLPMLEQACNHHPELAGRLALHELPLSRHQEAPFDAILMVAVAMHLSDSDLKTTLGHLPQLLTEQGLFILSASRLRSGLDEDCRDSSGRLYLERDESFYQSLLADLGFRLVKRGQEGDSLGREDLVWFHHVYRRIDDKASSRGRRDG